MSTLDDPRGSAVDDLAWRAERLLRAGQRDEAQELFALAAAIEQEIAESASHAPTRVMSVLAVSAVALWYKAARWKEAERLAHRWLAEPALSPDAYEEIRDILQRCWVEAQLDPELLASTFPLELRLVGGQIRRGLAPARLVRNKQSSLVATLERLAEWKLGRPYRERGRSSFAGGELQILQAPARAASYGLRLYVRSTIEERGVTVGTQALLQEFFSLVASPIERLETRFSEANYRTRLASHLRDLCADGEQVADVVYSSPTWRVRLPEVHLGPEIRRSLEERVYSKPDSPLDDGLVEGILNTVRLASDKRYIEIRVHGDRQLRIALVDDDHVAALGALLNRPVRATTGHEGRERILESIEAVDEIGDG